MMMMKTEEGGAALVAQTDLASSDAPAALAPFQHAQTPPNRSRIDRGSDGGVLNHSKLGRGAVGGVGKSNQRGGQAERGGAWVSAASNASNGAEKNERESELLAHAVGQQANSEARGSTGKGT